MPSRALTEAEAGCAAGTPSTCGTLTTAVTPVTVQRGSGAARMPFLAAKDVPPPAGGSGGGHVSISGLKQKMLDGPSVTHEACALRRLPSATLLSPCVKRVYDSPSAVLESALTR